MAERAEPITPKPGKSLSALVRLVRQSTLIRLAADNGGQGGQRIGKVSASEPTFVRLVLLRRSFPKAAIGYMVQHGLAGQGPVCGTKQTCHAISDFALVGSVR